MKNLIRTALIDNDLIEYYLIDPTGNITILVESFVSEEKRQYIASKLMEIEKSSEQVGYINLVDITLRMSANEFCGNATMSTAALACYKQELPIGTGRDVIVDTSGVKAPVVVNITRETENDFKGIVEMPAPNRIYNYVFEFDNNSYEFPVVDFGGISHVVILSEGIHELEKPGKAQEAVKKWCFNLKCEALGLMFVDITNIYVNKVTVHPLVYVPECGTCIWENSCGSGTTAVGAYLAQYVLKDTGRTEMIEASEPGGTLGITVTSECKYLLNGHVHFIEGDEIASNKGELYDFAASLCEKACEESGVLEEFWSKVQSHGQVLQEFEYYYEHNDFSDNLCVAGITVADILIWQIDRFKAALDEGKFALKYNGPHMILGAFYTMCDVVDNPEKYKSRFGSETGSDYPGKTWCV